MKLIPLHIIPRDMRRRGAVAAVTIFVRAVLNFAGLAVLVPVLILILDAESMHSNRWLAALYAAGGFTSDFSFAAAVCCGVVAFVVVKCAVNMWLYRFERDYTFDLYRTLSRRLYVEYRNRGMAFVKHSNSAILSRNVNFICLQFVNGILHPAAAIASDTALIAMMYVALFVYNPAAAAFVLLIFIPAAALYWVLLRKKVDGYGREENEAQRAKARTVADTFRGYADIEINGAFPLMLSRFDSQMERIVRVRRKNAAISLLPQMFMETGLAAGMAVFVLAGMATDAGADVKVLFGIFAVAALRLMPSARNIMGAWTQIKYNRYVLPVMEDAVRVETSAADFETAERIDFEDKIEVRDLAFRFDDAGCDTLHGLSFTIRRGERIGIRGRSGAGKTTLFNLLMGFYAPTGGEILIDGKPLDAAMRRRWQNTIGYVAQSVFLTDGTFAANVALGVPEEEVDYERVDAALAAAEMKTFVDSLPHGADTPVGECGCRLSGGQRQRIGIARALYRRADILLFDEATSSLDAQTERDINEAIAALSARRRELTIIAIAHRESSLDYCDRIINIE